jgi:4-amino-4-deoxy-L-arabinose transferase-like glycosyltransferase
MTGRTGGISGLPREIVRREEQPAVMPTDLSNRRWWVGLCGIGVASFLACLLVDFLYFDSSSLISGDEARFLRSAAGLLAHGQFRVGADVAWEMPGTAIFFAAITAPKLAAPVAAIRIANALLVAGQAVLLGLLAARLFRDRLAGLAAALLGGFYPYVVFTQGMALSETPFDFLLVAGLLAVYRWRDDGARIGGRMAVAVAILTAATYVKGTLTILAPLLVAAGAVGRRPWRDVARICAVASLLFAALMSPWWARNAILLDTFVPFTTSSTMNFYMGNSPNNPGVATYGPDLPDDWAIDHGVALEAIPGELDRYDAFRDRAVAFIRADPAAFVRRALVKFAVFWNIFPNAPAFQGPLYRWAGAATFGPVLMLALVCAGWWRRRWADLLGIYIVIVYVTALYTLTIPSIRYRLPLDPLLIVLASFPLSVLIRQAMRFADRATPLRSP